MTKTQELAALDTFIKTVGPHSYLGPWLTEYRGQIELAIQSDALVGVPMPHDAYREAAQILADAKAEAADIKQKATDWAAGYTNGAKEQVESYRRRARRELEKLAGEI